MKKIRIFFMSLLVFMLSACSPEVPTQDSKDVSETKDYESFDDITPEYHDNENNDENDDQESEQSEFSTIISDINNEQQSNESYNNIDFTVTYIDVGQGDSILVQSSGKSMLIDAGTPSSGTLIRSVIQKRGITSLDYLILTHPDADHIGGAASVIENVPINNIFMPNKESTSKTYEKTMDAIEYMRLKAVCPDVGSSFPLGSVNFNILAPIHPYDDNNNNSICIMLYAGNTKFLFVGDAEENECQDLVDAYGTALKADVYKAGHHGSRNSSTDELLDMVSPDYAVISCAEGNDYGHPHAATMNRFLERGIHVWRTDVQGSIEVRSDGEKILYDTTPCDDYTSGDGAIKSDREDVSIGGIATETENTDDITYILNTNTLKFHVPTCESVSKMSDKNKQKSNLDRESIILSGYEPCGICKP